MDSEFWARELDPLRLVIETLDKIADFDSETVMIIGAQCRDALHKLQGHDFPLRSTTDLDIAIAISDWEVYERIVSKLRPSGDTGIRFIVSGIPVDIMPFGTVENPRGSVTPRSRSERIDVFAFREIFTEATPLELGPGSVVRLPTRAGYSALKMKAWCDRSIRYEERDASDLAVACYWYQNDPEVIRGLYESLRGNQHLENAEFNQDLAALAVMAEDIRGTIGIQRASELKNYWEASDLGYLSKYFTPSLFPPGAWTSDLSTRQQYARHLGLSL